MADRARVALGHTLLPFLPLTVPDTVGRSV